MKVKTPEQLAKESAGKAKFTLYLDVSNMEEISRRAAKAQTSSSKIVNEAIHAYLAVLKEKKSSD